MASADPRATAALYRPRLTALGVRDKLADYDTLSKPGRLGNVYAVGGGYEDSPLAGGMLDTEDTVSIVPAQNLLVVPQAPDAPAWQPDESTAGGGGGAAGDGGVGDGGAGDGGVGDGGDGGAGDGGVGDGGATGGTGDG